LCGKAPCILLKTPSLVQKKSGTYVKFDQIYSTFCVKICRFSLPWQQGLVRHKVHFHTLCGWPVKLSIWLKSLDDISYTSWVIANFLLKLPFLVIMVTRVSLEKCWMIGWSPKPQFCENSGTYVKCELSYCDFCLEISKFSLPWQQGLVWHKFLSHS